MKKRHKSYDLTNGEWELLISSWVQGERNREILREFIVDGSKSPHWTVEQTSAVAASVGVCLDHVTDLEFSVAMNMIYSDFCMTARKYGTDTATYYGDMAKAWLFDPDGGEPYKKLYRKYKYMVLPART